MKKIILLLLVLIIALTSCTDKPSGKPSGNPSGGIPDSGDGGTTEDPGGTDNGDEKPAECGHYVSKTEGKKKASCKEEGYTGDTVCYSCGVIIAEGKIIEKTPHSYKNGFCSYCGNKEPSVDDTTPPHTHSYVAEVYAPTCTKNGYTSYTCDCYDFYIADRTEPLGHSFASGVCTVCGEADPGTGDSECMEHEDVDNDGYCDLCSEYVIVIIDIYAINDLHGKITPSDSQPGLGGLTTYLKNNTSDNSVLISSGDMWQGSSESNLTYGAYITEWMNELGFVSMTMGNHEFDWGESYITSNSNLAAFPFLAINIYDINTNKLVDYVTPSVVVKRGDIEIGIIGAIGNCYSSISGDVVGDFYFKVGDELTELVKAESERLRAEGVDFIIYSVHEGGSGYDYELSDGYVDLVLEAHTHKTYIDRDSYGVYHLQGGGENKGLGYAELTINSANGNSDVTDVQTVSSSVYSSLTDDPLVEELLQKYAHLIDRSYEVLGTNSKHRSDSEIEQLVAKLYYEFGVERWGDVFDITLGGGFLKTRNPYNLAKGEVLYSDVYSLLPFDNNIVLCSISGKDLLNKFINSSSNDYYIYSDKPISQIEAEIDPNATYYIITDTYTSSYASNRLTEKARYDVGFYARDLVADYIREGNME